MKYNPDIHHRRPIRLKRYDYSKEGMYFITICTQNREALFGRIVRNSDVGANLCVRPSCKVLDNNKIVSLNIAGEMIEKWIKELSNKYENIKCNEYVIMPNHIHFIIEIIEGQNKTEGEHTGSPLQEMIKWYKTMTTNEYIKLVKNGMLPPFDKKIWQRNYYENIIRDEKTYIKVSEYIKNNPVKWVEDRYYVE